MDGVLVETDRLKAEAHAATVRSFGGDVPAAFYALHMGKAHSEVRAAFLAKAEIHADLNEYTRRYQQIYRGLLKTDLRVAPGAIALLTELSSDGFDLALVSSSRSWMIDDIMKRTGMGRFFSVFVSAEAVRNPKPAPDAYLRAAELLNLTPRSLAVIEDSQPGVEAADTAHMPVFAVQNSFNRNHDFGKAICVFPSLEAVAQILKAIRAVVVPVPTGA